jgi:hypothetical protein
MEKRKRGAPKGNKNAVGNRGGGAPVGNTNAQKHGLYGREGLLNRKSQEKLKHEIREWLHQQRVLKYWAEKLYNGEITPDDFCRRYDIAGILHLDLDGDVELRILKEKFGKRSPDCSDYSQWNAPLKTLANESERST